MSGDSVPDDVNLLKLLWHPDDVDLATGQVLPTAFKSRDLSGSATDHVSTDREDMACRSTLEKVAQNQASAADGVVHKRHLALVGRLHCAAVRGIVFVEVPALGVIPVPIPGNDAHCGIVNIAGTKSRGYMTEVRGKLARLVGAPLSFDEAYGISC